MSPTALHSQRHPRAAKDGTLQNLAVHNTVSLHLVTPLLVQVAPTGPSGELTVHYGDAYDRGDYPPTGLRWESLPMHPGRPPLHNPALADHLPGTRNHRIHPSGGETLTPAFFNRECAVTQHIVENMWGGV